MALWEVPGGGCDPGGREGSESISGVLELCLGRDGGISKISNAGPGFPEPGTGHRLGSGLLTKDRSDANKV